MGGKLVGIIEACNVVKLGYIRWRPFTGKYVFTVKYGNSNWSELTA